ncbi:MAG: hypothetical protein JW795_01785 [Chitinivibrionales bacterium]|nr:hypothetical protein [Chitinivibrionales bacterium]
MLVSEYALLQMLHDREKELDRKVEIVRLLKESHQYIEPQAEPAPRFGRLLPAMVTRSMKRMKKDRSFIVTTNNSATEGSHFI